jgi:hypothetical protein
LCSPSPITLPDIDDFARCAKVLVAAPFARIMPSSFLTSCVSDARCSPQGYEVRSLLSSGGMGEGRAARDMADVKLQIADGKCR